MKRESKFKSGAHKPGQPREEWNKELPKANLSKKAMINIMYYIIARSEKKTMV